MVLFEELYPQVYDLFIAELKEVFPEFTIYEYEVSDIETTRFPYIVCYPLTMPRKRYIHNERNFGFDFRVRIVDRQPLAKAHEKVSELLKYVGKFVDNFDFRYYTVTTTAKGDISILGDTADVGITTAFTRDGAYVIIGMSFVYHFETAKYKEV